MITNPPKTERNNAILKDIMSMSISDVAQKYNISRQRVTQITGGVTKMRKAFVPVKGTK